jgi:hypothetical protein
MKFISLLMLIASLSVLNSAQAGGNRLNKTISLSNSITLSLDYTSNYLDQNDVGGPVGNVALPWINISGSGISATDNISVVLIDYDMYAEDNIDHPSINPTQVSNQTIDLHYDPANSKFTAQANVICLQSPDAYEKYFQEVAVVINGTWYKNGDQNFRFQLQY